jgi:hypothetical protein
MPDTPVIVDGAGQKFTIRLPKGQGQATRTFKAGGGGMETLELVPNVNALQIVVTNSQGLSVVQPLGTEWVIRIEEAP